MSTEVVTGMNEIGANRNWLTLTCIIPNKLSEKIMAVASDYQAYTVDVYTGYQSFFTEQLPAAGSKVDESSVFGKTMNKKRLKERICRLGFVKVSDPFHITLYTHLIHCHIKLKPKN